MAYFISYNSQNKQHRAVSGSHAFPLYHITEYYIHVYNDKHITIPVTTINLVYQEVIITLVLKDAMKVLKYN